MHVLRIYSYFIICLTYIGALCNNVDLLNPRYAVTSSGHTVPSKRAS